MDLKKQASEIRVEINETLAQVGLNNKRVESLSDRLTKMEQELERIEPEIPEKKHGDILLSDHINNAIVLTSLNKADTSTAYIHGLHKPGVSPKEHKFLVATDNAFDVINSLKEVGDRLVVIPKTYVEDIKKGNSLICWLEHIQKQL